MEEVLELPRVVSQPSIADAESVHVGTELPCWTSLRLGPISGASVVQTRVVGASSSVDFVSLKTLLPQLYVGCSDGGYDVKYLQLHEAVSSLVQLPRDSSSHVDSDTAQSACRLLSLMALYDVDPPKVFSHGGDSIVFTWQRGMSRLYLTICDGEADLIEMHPNARHRCQAGFSISNIEETDFWMKLLGGRQWKPSAI